MIPTTSTTKKATSRAELRRDRGKAGYPAGLRADSQVCCCLAQKEPEGSQKAGLDIDVRQGYDPAGTKRSKSLQMGTCY